MLVLSVPTFWYAPYLLVDPGSICARAAFVLAVVSGQPWLAAAAGIAGTAVREENILLLVWLVATRRIAVVPGLAALAAAGAWILTVRWYLITGLPSYLWQPSVHTVLHALADKRSLLSLAAGAGVVLPLAMIGMRIDGRAIWGLYPFLIPFAASVALPRGAKRKLALH